MGQARVGLRVRWGGSTSINWTVMKFSTILSSYLQGVENALAKQGKPVRP